MQLIFTFTLNTETKEAMTAGNINIGQAANLLQQLVIQSAVQEALSKQEGKKDVSDKPVSKETSGPPAPASPAPGA